MYKTWLGLIFWPIRASNSIVLSSQVTKLYKKVFERICHDGVVNSQWNVRIICYTAQWFRNTLFLFWHFICIIFIILGRSPYYRFKHENIWHFNITFFALDFFAIFPPYLTKEKTHTTKNKYWIFTKFWTNQFCLFRKIDKQDSFKKVSRSRNVKQKIYEILTSPKIQTNGVILNNCID